MRRLLVVVVAAAVLPPAVSSLVAQTARHPGTHQLPLTHHVRTPQILGFDQETVAAHFFLHPDGGAIVVTARDEDDEATVKEIGRRLPDLIQDYRMGRFEADQRHTFAGTAVSDLKELRDRVRFALAPLPTGGRIDIHTGDAVALAAVHEFLRHEIRTYVTGDSLDVTRRR